MKIIIVVIFSLSSAVRFTASALASPSCDRRFESLKLFNEGKSCAEACANIPLDFTTFECAAECQSYCRKVTDKAPKVLEELVGLYPGLTPAERSLAAAHPTEALRAYKLSWEAEALCKQIYFASDTNDESDACRHYVWSGLLLQNFGLSLSRKFLNAHEVDPDQPLREKEMDTANNELGLKASAKLISQKRFLPATLLESFKTDLKSGRLIILSPKKTKPKAKKDKK